MTLPQTYVVSLVLIVLSMICWGAWANTFKMAGSWRFEMFYFDFAIGAMLAAAVAAFTFGTLGSDGFQFLDDLMQTGKRNVFTGFVAGIVFNLGNMLLMAAISVAGMAMAFPVAMGLGLVIGVIWNYILQPEGNAVMLFGGAAVVLGAVVAAAFAYQSYAAVQLEARAKAGLLKTSAPRVSQKGLILSLTSGLLLGSFLPVVDMSRYGVGMGPYAIGFAFALGIFASTFVFNLFFMNLPVQGEPIDMTDYFRQGSWRQHLLGIGGGLIWFGGMIANLAAAGAEQQARVGSSVGYAIGQGAIVIGTLCGLLVWKEYAGADFRVKNLLYLMLGLFVCGLTLVAVSHK
jgi:glucose uptake protein